jgi:hypothetical protein
VLPISFTCSPPISCEHSNSPFHLLKAPIAYHLSQFSRGHRGDPSSHTNPTTINYNISYQLNTFCWRLESSALKPNPYVCMMGGGCWSGLNSQRSNDYWLYNFRMVCLKKYIKLNVIYYCIHN